jgi:AcrR family transcriptional regulator
MNKRIERETSRRGQETIAKLLEVTISELDRVGLAEIDIESLLRKSKISKGSLYHHFGSKNGLLAAAEAQQFMKYLKREGETFRRLIEECKTKQKFVELVAGVMKITRLESNLDFRKKRVRAIAMSFNDETLAEVLKNAQIEVTQYLADSFQIAKDSGWVKPDTDLTALSYWIQGVFIGHIVLDITEQTEHEEAWSEVAFQALQPFLAAD